MNRFLLKSLKNMFHLKAGTQLRELRKLPANENNRLPQRALYN